MAKDGIPLSIQKKVEGIIAEPLEYIINLCYQTGIFPSSLKRVNVKAIDTKKGDINDLQNCCPISMLSNVYKFYEKLLHMRMISFLNESYEIVNFQFGFRKGRSTIMSTNSGLDEPELTHNNCLLGSFESN